MAGVCSVGRVCVARVAQCGRTRSKLGEGSGGFENGCEWWLKGAAVGVGGQHYTDLTV